MRSATDSMVRILQEPDNTLTSWVHVSNPSNDIRVLRPGQAVASLTVVDELRQQRRPTSDFEIGVHAASLTQKQAQLLAEDSIETNIPEQVIVATLNLLR